MADRVVVTGIGCMSAVGLSLAAMWAAAVEGRTGIRTTTQFDTSAYDCQISADMPDWDASEFMDAKVAKRCDLFTQYAIAAADRALADADLEITEANGPDIGVVIGSGIGGMGTWESQHRKLLARGPSRVSPFIVPMLIVDMAAGMVSILTGARGPNWAAVSACASSTHAIGESFETIRRGAAKAMIAGGAEAALSPTGVAGFCAAKALSTRNDDPSAACRPFDKARDGFVMGEGACIVLLEELGHAESRGARIYGEIVGYGASGDAYNVVAPRPDGSGAAQSMRAALTEAKLDATDIDYVNAHAPGTPGGDAMEAQGLQTIYTPDNSPIVSSTKPVHGHMLGATGAAELALSLMVIRDGVIPRTQNCDDPDDGIWLDIVRGENRQARVDTVMTNSFGFGGHNAVLIARRYDQ